MLRVLLSAAWLLLALLPGGADADGTPLGMSVVETDDVELVYFDRLRHLVPHALRAYKNSFASQRRTFGWTPSERVMVLLKDAADYGNAAASAFPRNRLYFDVAPLSHAFETYPASERLYTLMNHELVHVAQSDLASPEDLRWRRFFLGKPAAQPEHPETMLYSYLAGPRFIGPRWFHEGGATFMETWLGGGLGRAQGGYDEMVFRAMVRDDAPFFDPLGLESRGMRVDFQTGATAYLYGTRFFTWLAYEYGPDRMLQWMRRDEGSLRWYADQFRHVFGSSLEDAWQRWIAFERDFQRANLAQVREHPVTPYRRLQDRALGSISRTYYDASSGRLYGAFRMPGIVEHVGAVDLRDGTLHRIADIKRAMHYRVSSFAFDPDTKTAFYTNDNVAFRDLMAVDVKTGAVRMLLEDARIGDVAFNRVDRSLLGVLHDNGFATLVRIPHPYDAWQELHRFPYGVVPYDLDISADGRLVSASMSEVNGDQYLRVWEIGKVRGGDVEPLSEFRFGDSVPESFVFSPDGRYLYGSSYYTGVSNIFRYEVATGEIEAVTNAEVGFFRPLPLADGRMLVLAFTGAGFVPAEIAPAVLKDVSAIRFLGTELTKRYPVVKEWQVPAPATVDETKLIRHSGPYEPLRSFRLDNAFPVLQGYKDSVGFGFHANFSDPVGLGAVGATLAYTPGGDLPGNERIHAEVTGRYLDWRGSLAWNKSDFYDLFGPTKRSRKGFAAKLGYDHSIVWDEPRRLDLVFDFAYYDKIDTLPGAQNVATTFDRLTEFEVDLRYTDVRRSIGAVDDEKGVKWSALAGVYNVPGETAYGARGTLDYGWDLPIGNSSLWTRNAAGYLSGDREVAISNFYFGSFGNNYVDSREVKRYREWSKFPGFGIDELSGQTFVRTMVEWNLPPHVFESAGVPAFHAAWMRTAVFASGLWTDFNDRALRRDYQNAGVQVDFFLSVLHRYNMTLSLGYAAGFTGGRHSGNEFMVSLKIM